MTQPIYYWHIHHDKLCERATEPIENRIDIHAEMDCLRKLPIRSKPDTLVIYKENATGKVKNGHPCKDCMRLIIACGISKVVYSDSNNNKLIFKAIKLYKAV
mgnify:FL=1